MKRMDEARDSVIKQLDSKLVQINARIYDNEIKDEQQDAKIAEYYEKSGKLLERCSQLLKHNIARQKQTENATSISNMGSISSIQVLNNTEQIEELKRDMVDKMDF